MRYWAVFIVLMMLTVGAARAQDGLMDLYTPHMGEGRNQLSQPHRSIGQLSDYLADISVELFSISQTGMKEELLANQKYFTREAFRAYLQFLQNSGYLPVMQELKLTMTGLSESSPLLISKGLHEGAYNWIYSVPVTVILGGNPTLPEKRLPRPEVVTLRLQIGRDGDAPAPEFVVINGFQVGDRQMFGEAQEAAE